MKIILDDIECKNDLYPFTLTRSAADIRIGILTIREKWERMLDQNVYTTSEIQETKKKSLTIFPANILSSLQLIKSLKHSSGKDLSKLNPVSIKYPWHIFQHNDVAIKEDFELLTRKRKSKKISYTNKIIGKNIFLEDGAIVEHSILNASFGPIYIGKNAEVMEGCTIRGPFALCEGSKLKMGTKIYGATTIGPYCMAGGEIKNSILFGYSNKSHDGYLGDTVIGEWCNLGAGTSTSNVKNTADNVKVRYNAANEKISAGLKCGLLMGDYSRSAINTSFNTGTIVGTSCNVFSNDFPPTFIPSFSWGDKNYELKKALQHIENWKRLKEKNLTEKEKIILSDIYYQKNNHA